MKKILICFVIISCSQKKPVVDLSASQQWISNTVAELRKEFLAASNDIGKNEIKSKYQEKINNYFKDHPMDSLSVETKEIKMLSESRIVTEFTDDNAEYRFLIEFKEKPTDRDSIYSLLKKLKQGDRTKLSFFYLSCRVNDPDNQYMKAIYFEAIPAPLSIKSK